MNQNIARSAENCTGHTKGKAYIQSGLQGPVQLKENTAGRNVAGERGKLPVIGGEQYRQSQRKAHRATHFLAGVYRVRSAAQESEC